MASYVDGFLLPVPKKNLKAYFQMAEKYIPKAREAGMKVNGTVSTIWGCPIEGPTDMKKAIEFTKRWFDIGASDVEHADHDGSASPARVYRSGKHSGGCPIFPMCSEPPLI